MNSNNEILVTCACITFNHKDFIRQCLDGMLMQETTFPYEIIVYDDCSTDGTREIVKEYAALHPDKIRTVLPEENQYSKLGDVVREVFVHPLVRGKYVALCEGDDFWTDPQKIQKQADFMEENPDYSVCFHEFYTCNVTTKKYYASRYSRNGDFDVSRDLLINGRESVAQPLTMMYRFSCWSSQWYIHYKGLYRDTVENFHLLRAGKGRFLRFIGGVYNLQSTGVSSQMPRYERARLTLPTFIEMYSYTGDKVLKQRIVDTALWALRVCDEEDHPDEKKNVWKELHRIPWIMMQVRLMRIKRLFIARFK